MILAWAVLAGLLAGLLRAWYTGRKPQPPAMRWMGLVFWASVPQLFAFHIAATSGWVTDHWASVILVASQTALLFFAWRNRHLAGGYALGLGLGLNLLVIVLNGGLMPISPETLSGLLPHVPADYWEVGSRLGTGKDVILPAGVTRLGWLSDRFLLPAWLPYQVAFSIGDVFIAVGAFQMLWTIGKKRDASQYDHYLGGSLAKA